MTFNYKVAEQSKDDTPKSTEQKIKANRENAKKSTGPKTERGKRNSSFNAIKHGLLISRIPYAWEYDAKACKRFAAALQQRYGGQDDLRNELQMELAFVDYWRLRRGLDAEKMGLAAMTDYPGMAELILRYNKANRRSLMQTMDQLEEARERRINSSVDSEPISRGECVDSPDDVVRKPMASMSLPNSKSIERPVF